MIGPPYDPSFVQLFLPLLQNEAIAGTISLRTEEERKCIKEFIGNHPRQTRGVDDGRLFIRFRSCLYHCRLEYLVSW